MKSDGHLGRCHLKGPERDAANIVFTAVDRNLRLTPGLRDQIVCGSRKVAAVHQALVPLKSSTIKNNIEASVPLGEIRGFERATMHQLGPLARFGPSFVGWLRGA
ncbi:hypothetical protein XH97_02810 [Bradyrhizobium sp. CCBAU 53380]|nr:hypothetical protein [Bradyrhizobium sp. CCBAU 53380]MDA9421081.1 hypothetical protein [Bradyrhizobium sp. CCBAU 53380]